MKNKNLILSGMLVLTIFLVGILSASNSTSYCCEKTNEGAWCQNSEQSDCNQDYQAVPASCEATSYCKMGCCYSIVEGTCTENSPEKVCEDDGGVWADDAQCNIDQCNLGCCLIGDQAAFVTPTRCKRLANLYGLDIDFRTDITSEFECISSISSQAEGACVYMEDYQINCLFTTQKECNELAKDNATFHEGKLCSDQDLGTTCAPTQKTTCVDGKDQVYFVDSCGNIANVYDASKVEDLDYWANIYDVSESCNYGSSNAGSASCGNCDYYLGSACKDYKRSEDSSSPTYGDYLCKDLSCTYDGVRYEHGETWCANQQSGSGASYTVESSNSPGSRYFRLMCYNKEVIIEPCADYRSEICVSSVIDGFSSAGCVVNAWQDCFLQTDVDDCENADLRDCKWLEGININENGTQLSDDDDEDDDDDDSDTEIGTCVPKYAPGFDFWNSEGDSEDICNSASTSCVVKYETDLFGNKECVENCDCLTQEWEDSLAEVCTSLGDCGHKTNFMGQHGYKEKDYVVTNSSEDDEDDEDD